MTNLARQVEYGPRAGEYSPPVLFVVGTKATVGSTTVIAAPGAQRQIVIDSIILQNETDNVQTILLLNTAGSQLQRVVAPLTGNGIARSKLRWPVGENLGVVVSISAAFQVGYSISYYYESTV